MSAALYLGDLAHLASFGLLIFRIENGKSCVGFSGKMQVLHVAAYLTRYWDFIFFDSIYTTLIKILCITLSIYVIYIIFIKYKKTYEKRCDSFWIESIILTSITLSFCSYIDEDIPTPEEIALIFSRCVESVSIIPQIYFYILKQQKDDSVTYYVMILTLYRGFYLVNLVPGYLSDDYFDPSEFYPGMTQIVLYGVYLLLPKGKQEPLPIYRNVPPKFLTQLSLLETPLLKRTTTASSSIYIIERHSSYSNLSNSFSMDTQSTSSETERY